MLILFLSLHSEILISTYWVGLFFILYLYYFSIEDFWDWTEYTFADSVHLQETQTDEEHGYLLGVARMRLIRSTSGMLLLLACFFNFSYFSSSAA